MRAISLGAGVQSTTMALMAAAGEIGPMPDCAIFADTQSEPKAVYRHLDWLETVLPFPVHRVTAGSLRDEILSAARREIGCHGRPPFFMQNADGTPGMIRRQCTGDYKIDPLDKKVRDLLGLIPRQRWPKTPMVERWIGISTDEASRMKGCEHKAIKHRWPLIEQRMSRWDCLRWLERKGYPAPPKSACTFCPFHSDDQWRDLRDNHPDAWADAVALDDAIADGFIGLTAKPFLHRSLKRLRDVDLSTDEDRGQLNMFNNECEGMCGV